MKLLQTDLKEIEEFKKNSKPIIRWAGGKRRLLKQIYPLLPKTFNRYYEPFFGGGALFFSLGIKKKATISDLNEELISFYQVVKETPEELYHHISKLKVNEKEYYKIRKMNPQSKLEEATRFLYLNKSCFNGLYRVNRKGEFNVPYGKRDDANIIDLETIKNASEHLKGITILNKDFEYVKKARKGDFVYFDPPYTVLHNKNGFIEYNKKIFSWDDQKRLKELIDLLTNKGVYVAISNAHHKSIEELYKGYYIHEIYRSSTISGHENSRLSNVAEYFITNYKGECKI